MINPVTIQLNTYEVIINLIELFFPYLNLVLQATFSKADVELGTAHPLLVIVKNRFFPRTDGPRDGGTRVLIEPSSRSLKRRREKVTLISSERYEIVIFNPILRGGGHICPPYHISAIFSGRTYPRRLQVYCKFKFCNYRPYKIGPGSKKFTYGA